LKACTKCKARFTGNPTRCPLDGGALVDLPDPLLGKTVGGRYRIESKIGSGGMASVYRASNDLLGRKVAIKFLAPELSLDETQRKRFLREAQATNRIKHENIVDIMDYGQEDNGLVYLVMELLEGEPLAHRVARGPLPPAEAIDFLMQTARALARAHELEVIHRDLKPENVFLVPRASSWLVKLLDFGLAHIRNEARLTASGAVFGTPEYMSPEQARGAPIGPTSDLYALGVVFFEMLTGRLPFEGSTAELIVKHIRSPAPPPSRLNKNLGTDFDPIVLKMLAKEPEKRHRDAYHVLEDLAALQERYPLPRPRAATGPRARPESGVNVVGDATLTPPGKPERPTTSPLSVQSWVERRAALRNAVKAAYPERAMPDWVARLVGTLEAQVDRAVALEAEMQRVARALAERESAVSDARERIGRALDELSRDESAIARQTEDLEKRLERAASRTQQMAADFQRGLREATTGIPDGAIASAEHAALGEAVGRRATAWRQAAQELEDVRGQIQARAAARADVRFQVEQLKGRLAAVNADAEMDLNALRERASELGAQMAATQEQLLDAASRLTAHAAEFPAARPLVQGLRALQPNAPRAPEQRGAGVATPAGPAGEASGKG
jgi:serine/threonine-protein kinase